MSGITSARFREIEDEIDDRDEDVRLLIELFSEVKRLQGDIALASEIKQNLAPSWLREIQIALTPPGQETLQLTWEQSLVEMRRLRTRFSKLVDLLRENGNVINESAASTTAADLIRCGGCGFDVKLQDVIKWGTRHAPGSHSLVEPRCVTCQGCLDDEDCS
jgi:hypothetical protein